MLNKSVIGGFGGLLLLYYTMIAGEYWLIHWNTVALKDIYGWKWFNWHKSQSSSSSNNPIWNVIRNIPLKNFSEYLEKNYDPCLTSTLGYKSIGLVD